MADEDDLSQEAKDAIADWVRHPLTDQVARGFAHEAQTALMKLISAARVSTDPKVTACVAQYEILMKAKKTMTGEG